MPIVCAVIGCTNRHATIRIPKVVTNQGREAQDLSERRRREWIRQIGREDITFTSATYQRICKIHFVTGTMSSKNYNQRLKENDPVKYQVLLDKARVRSKRNREARKMKWTTEPLTRGLLQKIESFREKERKRGREYYSRKRARINSRTSLQAEVTNKLGTPPSKRPRDMDRVEKRNHNRKLQQLSRLQETPKKTWCRRKKDRENKKINRAEKKQKISTTSSNPMPEPCSPVTQGKGGGAAAAQWNQHHPDWIPTLHMGHDILWKSDSGRKKPAVGERRADVQGAVCSSDEETHPEEPAAASLSSSIQMSAASLSSSIQMSAASQSSSIQMSPVSTRSKTQKRRAISTEEIQRGRQKVMHQDQGDEGVINVGREFARWCQLAEELGVISNEAVAGILLDLYYAQSPPAYSDDGEAVSNPLARPVALYKVAAKSSPRSSIEDTVTAAAECNGTAEQQDLTALAEVKIETDVAQDPFFTGNHNTQHHQLNRPVKEEPCTENTASSLQTEDTSPATQAVSSTYLDVRVKQEAADYD